MQHVKGLTTTKQKPLPAKPTPADPGTFAAIQLVTETRLAMGWKLEPADVRLMAATWKEHLDEQKIDHRLYPLLVKNAVAHAAESDPGRPIGVPLIIAQYKLYKTRTYERLNQLKHELTELQTTRHRYATGQLPDSKDARAQLENDLRTEVGELDKDAVLKLIDAELDRYQSRVDTFLKDHFIANQ